MSQELTSRYGELIDKLILFLCSFALSQLLFAQTPQLLAFLLALIFISLLSYLDPSRWRRLLLGLFSVLCLFLPPLTIYLPAALYEILETEPLPALIIPAIPLILLPFRTAWTPFLVLLPLVAIGLRLSLLSTYLKKQRNQSHHIQDRLRETRATLAKLEQVQSEQQETEVRLATLNERNRIARDIHDNVGHLLSSALLQTAALLSGPGDNEKKGALVQLKETLEEGLDRIRNSVHQLHESPLDLENEISRLMKTVTSCSCRQTVELQGIPEECLRQCLLAVIREALSNVIRHSNATELNLTLKEHPAFYQLAIADNGSPKPIQDSEGLGLRSISERISLLGGRLHITSGNGFTLFITLPKEKAT